MKKAEKICGRENDNVKKAEAVISEAETMLVSARKTMGIERREVLGISDAESAKRKPRCKSKREDVSDVNKPGFPIVGIGVSAGGLESLQDFFSNIKEKPDVAFVIIQHLSPNHNSFMGELLSRYTTLPVAFIEDGMKVEKNRIYLIPPKVNITIRGAVLHHSEIIGTGLNLPIDIFFRSLAEDQKSNAVAIIMSGAGSDGTLGIRSIKEFGGITMVQNPHDAKFDGMPRSALSTDMVDLVRTAADLAHELVSYLGHPLFTHSSKQPLATDCGSLYERVLALLKDAKKVDFSSYRRETIARRLEKRISINRFANLSDYVNYLSKNPEEVNTLFHEILIGVTRFFRDADSFEALEKNCFPSMFSNAINGELRIWVASCSTGEEAYSIAILLKEYMFKNHIVADVKIFATDIDDKSLKFASVGFYPQNVVSDIPPQYLAKYFIPHGNGYQITPDIRSMIIFAAQDLIDNPPFFKLDLITCRNFLIYICPKAQQRVLSSFYVGLKTGGFLFLGPSESLEDLARGFDVVSASDKIFKKRDGYTPDYSPKSPMPLHLTMLEHPQKRSNKNISQENNELLSILGQVANGFLPPSLVVDSSGDIVYTVHDVGNILRMSFGRMTTNLLKILPKDLGLIISSLIRRATGKSETISAEIVIEGYPTTVRCKSVVSEISKAAYFYISFERKSDKKPAHQPLRAPTDLSNRYQERIDELEAEVMRQKESLRMAVEQLETGNEELQASNEELVASNEELQSSNEELQSVNEELYTVNIEHVRKLEEITQLNYDYDNLISNTQIGTLYLDANLVVRKISKIASGLLNIMQSDVGKPLSYFSLRKIYPKFLKDVEQVNSTGKMVEREMLLRGKTYCMRIVSYLAEENSAKGVIISFMDLTDCKMRALKEAYESQEKSKISDAQLEAAAEIAKLAYFKLDVKTGKYSGSKMLSQICPISKGIMLKPEKWIEPDDVSNVKAKFNELRSGRVETILLNFRSAYYGSLQYYRLGASIRKNASGGSEIAGVIQNITGPIEAQLKVDERERFWDAAINAIPVLFYAKDADDGFRYIFANRYFQDFTNKTSKEIIGKIDEDITPSGGEFNTEDLEVLEKQSTRAFENRAVMSNGDVRYFHTTKHFNVRADGHRLIMGIGIDSTEQHHAMQDIQTANDCLSALVECENYTDALTVIMENLCRRMGAEHCFWLSFDHDSMTVKCEFEHVVAGGGKKLFADFDKMPFSPDADWYQCYLAGRAYDIADIVKEKETSALLGKFCGYPKKLEAKSVYSVCFRNKGEIAGAVGFLYAKGRPEFSEERLAYLSEFVSNLFKNILARKRRKTSE